MIGYTESTKYGNLRITDIIFVEEGNAIEQKDQLLPREANPRIRDIRTTSRNEH